jgi:hypothetical protein
MALTYEHLLSNWALCKCVDIVQNIVDKRAYVHAKVENGEMLFIFSIWKEP